MRKLSRLFMTLSALCFAMPAFAQGGGMTDASWVAITAGFSMAIAFVDIGSFQIPANGASPDTRSRHPDPGHSVSWQASAIPV